MVVLWKIFSMQLLMLVALPVLCRGEVILCRYGLEDLVDVVRHYVDSIFGVHRRELCWTFWEMALQFVADGAAGGLNVIAVYTAEILSVFGVDPVSIPQFTSQGVALAAQWALLALITYWLLFLVLRVGLTLIRRVFWILKVIGVLWIFIWIITDPNISGESTAVRLFWLVLVTALWSIASRAQSGTDLSSLERRLKNLEGRVSVVEKNKGE